MQQHHDSSADSAGPEDADLLEFAHRLLDAARAGDEPFVTSAVDQGVPANLTDANGNTLLMLAAYHGHSDLVAALAERGADVDRANDRGQTPLAGAVFKRHDPVIAALITHGANLDAGTPSARATAEMFGITLPTA